MLTIERRRCRPRCPCAKRHRHCGRASRPVPCWIRLERDGHGSSSPARRSSMSAANASMPSPVTAEIATGGAFVAWSRLRQAGARGCRRRAGRSCSRLRSRASFGRHRRRDRAGCARHPRACAAVSGSEMSRRWITRSASTTSSSVARKAATRCVGRSEMKPTVSDRMTGVPCGSRTRRSVGSSVANSMSSRQHAAPGQPVEQRRLAGIGVADDRDDRKRHLLALGAVQVAGAPDRFQLALQLDDLFLQHAPVGFDLGFAGAAEEAGAAALAFKVGPAAHQPPLLVVQMREFDLQRAFLGPGASTENFEDQPGAVEDLGVQRLFEVALLHRRQRMVDDRRAPHGFLDDFGDLLDLAATQQRRRARIVDGHDRGMNEVELDGLRPGPPPRRAGPPASASAAARLVIVRPARLRAQHWHDDDGARRTLPAAFDAGCPSTSAYALACVFSRVKSVAGRLPRPRTSEPAGSA